MSTPSSQDIKHKVPSMEAAYKTATRNAQQLTKDLTEEEIAQMLAAMATIKDDICKVLNPVVSAISRHVKFDGLTFCLTSISQYLFSDQRESSAPAEGLPGHAASFRRNGEKHHWVLPVAGEGESHHFLP